MYGVCYGKVQSMNYCSLHQHSDASFLDSCNKPKDLATKAASIGMKAIALTDHGNVHNFIKMAKACKAEGVKFIPGCCMPGQIVYTERGPIPIEECTTEDRVLTHNGRFCKINQVSTRNYDGKTYTIQSWNNTDVTLTDEHPILVLDQNKERKWVRADEVEFGRTDSSWRNDWSQKWRHHTCFPRKFNFPKYDITNGNKILFLDILDDNEHYVEIAGYIHCQKNAKSTGTYGKSIWHCVDLNRDFGYFVGLWLAEGSFGKCEKVLNFTFGIHENRLHEFVSKFLENLECKFSVKHRQNKSTTDIEVYSKPLAQTFLKMFGKGCRYKSIPNYLLYINNNDFHNGLLEGILDGDSKRSEQTCLKLANRTLIYQVKMLLAQRGVSVRVNKVNEDHYYIQWRENISKARYTTCDEKYLYTPIRSVVVQDYNGPVYNLAVEQDESYLTDFCVHNCEFYFTDKHEKKVRKSRHITILCMNKIGLQTIYKLTTLANTPVNGGGGFYYRPRIDWEDFEKNNEGLICLTGCMNSPINHEFGQNNDYNAGRDVTKRLLSIFGRDRLFVELQMVNDPIGEKNRTIYIPEQDIIFEWDRRVAAELGLRTVATNDSHYLNKEDSFAHEILKCLDAKATLQSPIVDHKKGIKHGRLVFNGFDYHVKSAKEMSEKFTSEEIEMSQTIADMCNVDVLEKEDRMPWFKPGMTHEQGYEMMLEECRKGWVFRGINQKANKDEFAKRIKIELDDIKDANLANYFLIVWDIIRFCRSERIPVGPGRGSAAGSLVSYLLQITQVDPIEHKLLWERFYNRGRKGSMPDVDVDVSIKYKDKIVEYIRGKFGEDRVFPMMSFGTMVVANVLKDVAKAIGIPFAYMNALTKHIPHKCKDIDDAIERSKEIQEASKGIDEETKQWKKHLAKIKGDPANLTAVLDYGKKISEREKQLKQTFSVAKKLEGCAKYRSTHPCAILISNKPISGLVPLCWNADEKMQLTGFDMYDLEEIGFLKLDILGLKTLDVIADCHPAGVDCLYEPDKYFGPWDDQEVYKLLAKGRSKGVFQLESPLGRKFCRELAPKNLNELCDLGAILRPAVLEPKLDRVYLKNRADGTCIVDHPDLKDIFEPTHGIMLYQEQLIEMVKKIAGYSLSEADMVRKACGKKLPEVMKKQKAAFVNGAKANGYKDELINKLWEWILASAGYSFNKSHSMCYSGFLGYITTYVKIHYSAEFFLALLKFSKNEADSQTEIMEIFYDAKLFGIHIKSPDINKGNIDFELNGNEIYFGLSHIKHIGEQSIKILKKLGNLDWSRVLLDRKNLSIKKDVFMALALSGSFDSFGVTRKNMQEQFKFIDELTVKELPTFKTFISGGKIEKTTKKSGLMEFTTSGGTFVNAVTNFRNFINNENDKMKIVNARRSKIVESLCNEFILEYDENVEFGPREKAGYETYYLSIPVTCSQVDIYSGDPRQTHHLIEVEKEFDKVGCAVIALVNKVNQRNDKRGNEMAFIGLQDRTFQFDAVMFSHDWTFNKEKIQVGKILLIEGKKSKGGFQAIRVEEL